MKVNLLVALEWLYNTIEIIRDPNIKMKGVK